MPQVMSNGRVTIPAEIREQLGIRPSDEVAFEPSEEGYVLTKKIDENQFKCWKGVADTDQAVEERMGALRGGRD